MRPSAGLILIGIGGALALVGLLVWFGAFRWFGRLPGDIRIERDNAKVYIPLASMLLVSVLLSVGIAIVRALSNRHR